MRPPKSLWTVQSKTMRNESPMSDFCTHLLELRRLGLRLVPLHGKAALLRNWPDSHLTERDIRSWAACGVNWGIITGEPLIVLDTDTEAAEAWVHEHRIDSPVMVRTGRGGLHRYFRRSDGIQIRSRSACQGIKGLDVKGWRGYVVAAGSIHRVTGKCYAYLPGREFADLRSLPVFDPAWIREARPAMNHVPIPSPTSRTSGPIRIVRDYIRSISSIEGQGGDRACFAVACLLAEAGLSPDEILGELMAWNQQCAIPPWSPQELARKARCAWERVSGRCQGSVDSP